MKYLKMFIGHQPDCLSSSIHSWICRLYIGSQFILSLVICLKGVDVKKIDQCIGDPEADVDNPVLKAEQDAQVKETIYD